MLSFRLFLLNTFILACCHTSYEQNNTANNEDSPIPAEMKITSWNDMPFSGLVQENGTWVGKGYAFYLLKLLSSKLNFTYTIVPPKQHVLGNKEQGILNLLYEKKVDMVVAFLPILPELQNYCTFSTALDQSELSVLMKRPQESATSSGLLAPFDHVVWLLVLATVLFVGPIIYVFATLRAKLWNEPDSENFSLFSCVWFVYSSLLKQGSTMMAKKDSTRILFATWWIFILILTSFYTANLTAFLTKPQFTLPINNLEDIVRKGYEWVTYNGRTIHYLLSEHETEELSLLNATKKWKGHYISSYEYPVDSIFNAVKKDKLFLGEAHYLQSLLFEDYINKTREHLIHQKRCTYVIMPGAILVTSRAFAFPLNSTFAKPINRALMALVETGIIKREKLMDLPRAEVCPLDLRSTERQLSLNDLSLTFKVVLAGYAIATLVFFGEIMIRSTVNSYNGRKDTGKWCDSTLCCKRKRRTKESVTPQLVFTKNPLFNKQINLQKTSPRALYQNIPYGLAQGKKQCINGRDYYVVMDRYGDPRLIPIRTPSAFLFQYTA